MCRQRGPYKFCGKLYDKYNEIVQNYVNGHVLPLCHDSRNLGRDGFTAELPLIRERYEEVMKKYRIIFGYLDVHHVKIEKKMTLKEASTKLFVS
jgi:hypothetical protein